LLFSNPFVLGFHGCRRSVGEAVISGAEKHLKASQNQWDWLGSGIYFWESDPVRGYEWAVAQYGETEACVIGAVIHLGFCLDLMARPSLIALNQAYQSFLLHHDQSFPGSPLPQNRRTAHGPSHALDCAVINHLHRIREERKGAEGNPAALRAFETVRGLYQEGKGVFDGSMVLEKTHIQVCVRRPEMSILGYFRVPVEHYIAAVR
jgi:hypothetical protein